MTDFVEAAQSLVKKLAAPPQAHSVYIRTDVGDDHEFKRTLCVSWHPQFKGNRTLPDMHMGYPVEIVPWPKDL